MYHWGLYIYYIFQTRCYYPKWDDTFHCSRGSLPNVTGQTSSNSCLSLTSWALTLLWFISFSISFFPLVAAGFSSATHILSLAQSQGPVIGSLLTLPAFPCVIPPTATALAAIRHTGFFRYKTSHGRSLIASWLINEWMNGWANNLCLPNSYS